MLDFNSPQFSIRLEMVKYIIQPLHNAQCTFPDDVTFIKLGMDSGKTRPSVMEVSP